MPMTRERCRFVSALLVAMVLGGCPGPANLDDSADGAASGSGSGSGATGGGEQSGIPCDVAAIVGASCLGCHGSALAGGAPMRLVTYADLMATSPLGGTYAERSVIRMKDAVAPMPPLPAAPVAAADQSIFEEWVNAGAPMGDCGGGGGAGGGGPSPYDTPVVCSSDNTWTLGNEESDDMNPGQACLGCHGPGKEEAEDGGFLIGGTVYPTAHEPDNCFGVDGDDGTAVVVTDATKKTVTLHVSPGGNFYFTAEDGLITFPIRAKVVRGGSERVMAQEVDDGDCNGCHTLQGSGNPAAPGRIMAP